MNDKIPVFSKMRSEFYFIGKISLRAYMYMYAQQWKNTYHETKFKQGFIIYYQILLHDQIARKRVVNNDIPGIWKSD